MASKKRQSGRKQQSEAPQLVAAPSRAEVKLDFGCGKNLREGFEGVDKYAENAKHKVDLMKFPFPWADNSVDEIHCSHFLEHLPAREVLVTDQAQNMSAPGIIGQDFLCAFMDECWRVLKPNGTMTVIVPSASNDRAFQDPTHRRFFVAASFAYYSKFEREKMGIDHYLGKCDFMSNVVPIILAHEGLRAPEVQAARFAELRNTILDWQAIMTAIKPEPT